ncbi:MAG: DUF3368 domain-containing protein [Candidatus Lokiarchaeota archaeon]|nr:DUF3368 domain-containing protein [Candidatus Lokiarchaeota archaeon]
MIAVVNASPLIYLGKAGLLNLLQVLFDDAVVSRQVEQEVLDSSYSEYVSLKSAFDDWLNITETELTDEFQKLSNFGLHIGEVHTLALALQLRKQKKESVVVIDDLAARDVARTLDLAVTGTIGIILQARKQGRISTKKALSTVEFLVQETTFRMSTKLYSQVLSEIEG